MTDWTPVLPGPWQQDQAHTPVSATKVMQATYPEGFNRGFTETFARYGLLLDRLAMCSVNGFTYHQPQPFDLPGPDGPLTPEQVGAEIERRTAVAAETFETKRWRADLDDWDSTWKPNAIERHRALGTVDLASLDTAGLTAHLAEVSAHTTEMVYQHHRFNMAALLPVGDFMLHAAGWLGCSPTTLFPVLDGYSPISNVLSAELEPVVAAIRADDALIALVDGDGDPDKRVAELRDRCPAFDAYLQIAGCRVVDGFDVTAPTLLERPQLVLGRLAAAMRSGDDPRARADEFAAELRSQLDDATAAEFDALLAEARAVYRLRDERGIYSDISAIGLLRRALLDAGRRLVDAGALDDAELALDATPEELIGMLEGGSELTGADLQARRDARVALTAEGAPRYLGPPPPAPPPVDQLPPPLARVMSATGFLIEGILGQMDGAAGDATNIKGIPASPGTCEGTARVVRGIDDLERLQDGDILVAPTTGEAFSSMLHLVRGIVTDHGSFASHAGIVSREMGIPAVVGTVDASKRIPDGARVRIDGATGDVSVLM